MRCFNDSYGQCLLQMLRTVRVMFDPLADVSFMFRMLRNVAFPLQNHKCSTLCRLLSCSISANGQHHRIAAGAMLQCSGWLWPLAPKAICRNSLHQYIHFIFNFVYHASVENIWNEFKDHWRLKLVVLIEDLSCQDLTIVLHDGDLPCHQLLILARQDLDTASHIVEKPAEVYYHYIIWYAWLRIYIYYIYNYIIDNVIIYKCQRFQ